MLLPKNHYLTWAIREGAQFASSYFYMYTVGAEINGVIQSADYLAQHPLLGPVGDIASKWAHALEGGNNQSGQDQYGAISWGQYTMQVLGIDPAVGLYSWLGGETQIRDLAEAVKVNGGQAAARELNKKGLEEQNILRRALKQRDESLTSLLEAGISAVNTQE